MPVMPRRRCLCRSTRATDGNAVDLARIMQCGWYKEVRVKSVSCHEIRAVLNARAQLVKIKRDLENQIRGLARRTSVWSSARRAAPSSAAGSQRPPPPGRGPGARTGVTVLAWRASAERPGFPAGMEAATPRARRVVNRFLRNRGTHLQIFKRGSA